MKRAKLLAVIGAFGALTATAAWSAPADDIYWTYYSDASHTTQVGDRWLLCSGRSYKTGQTTAYYTIEYYPCGTGPL